MAAKEVVSATVGKSNQLGGNKAGGAHDSRCDLIPCLEAGPAQSVREPRVALLPCCILGWHDIHPRAKVTPAANRRARAGVMVEAQFPQSLFQRGMLEVGDHGNNHIHIGRGSEGGQMGMIQQESHNGPAGESVWGLEQIQLPGNRGERMKINGVHDHRVFRGQSSPPIPAPGPGPRRAGHPPERAIHIAWDPGGQRRERNETWV